MKAKEGITEYHRPSKLRTIEKDALKYINNDKLGDQLHSIIKHLVKKLKKFGNEFAQQINLLERMRPKNNKDDDQLIQ